MADRQHNLFDTEVPQWELDSQAEKCVATVVLSSGLLKPLSYSVPDSLRDSIEPGRRVRVPLGRGNRKVTGYCVSIENQQQSNRRLKNIDKVIDSQALLSPSLLRLTKWMADYYLCSWGQVLETVIPAGVRVGAGTRLTTLLTIAPETKQKLASLKLPKKQSAVIDHLLTQTSPMTPAKLASAVGCTQAPITALRRKGLIHSEVKRTSAEMTSGKVLPEEPQLKLNTDQSAAFDGILESLRRQQHETVLIHGVTGSGKTEVYMHAIQEVVGYGRQAIVLVPEISLTPQTVSRFRARFGEVAVLHSHLTDVQRHQQWARISNGSVQVIVGARSAVFAPTPHLGLIVIDEEHESSFKQETAPRYHARDVAQRRAEAEGVPLILGSATPSLESYQRSLEGHYKLVKMDKRVFERPLPEVNTIDLRIHEQDRWTRGAISRQLQVAMGEALCEEGQVILLLNRRGFSTHIQCPSCGQAVVCPACEISLTHHKQQDVAICHYCDHSQTAPNHCSHCGFTGLQFSGRGTQRLEDEVRKLFPQHECLRMDTDTMQRRGSHEEALARFRNGEIQILLGTQMIAKGLDFPNVTLVGVINADTALHLPDFRAAERTFQLVTQVAGRTGRSKRGGHVLVQTCQPDHPAIQAAIRHDYAKFAEHELPMRRALKYPPFGAMVRLVIRGPGEVTTKEFASTLASSVRKAGEEKSMPVRILGPAAAPLAKLRGNYRFAIHLQGPPAEDLSALVKEATLNLKAPDDILWIADVDPLDMM